MIKKSLSSFVLLLLSLNALAKEPLNSIPSKIIPYGWELTKTTCDELEKKLPIDYINKDKEGNEKWRTYGVDDKILLFCNFREDGFMNVLSRGKFYSNKSLRKIGFRNDMNSAEALNSLLNNYNITKDKIKFIENNDKDFELYIDSDTKMYFSFWKEKLSNVYIIVEPPF